MTKGWQKFTGCWRNRIFISKYNYFVHLKCWIIWISAISSLLCWDITRRFSCKCLASKFVPLQGISNYLKLPRGSSDCSSDVLVKWWNCCNIHFEHLNIIHLNCALFSNIQIKCVEGLETGEILSLEDEISHLQKENSRIESQLSRMKGDVNSAETEAVTEDKVRILNIPSEILKLKYCRIKMNWRGKMLNWQITMKIWERTYFQYSEAAHRTILTPI